MIVRYICKNILNRKIIRMLVNYRVKEKCRLSVSMSNHLT